MAGFYGSVTVGRTTSPKSVGRAAPVVRPAPTTRGIQEGTDSEMHKATPTARLQMGPIGAVNQRGLYTLCRKEVGRFLKVYSQTVVAPVVTTMMFCLIFALALGRAVEEVDGVPFMQFLAPGLIMMAIVQNAFTNTSSSVIISKIQGNIVDVLMAPLSPLELAIGYVFGGMMRGLVVGFMTSVILAVVLDLAINHILFVLYHAVMASMLLSVFGLIIGIWAEKFDHIAAITNFVVTPLSFLSGTFYSVDRLPKFFWWIAHFNPFFYMIDGFRYGFVGVSDGSVWLGVIVLVFVNASMWLFAWRMLSTGYKLKP